MLPKVGFLFEYPTNTITKLCIMHVCIHIIKRDQCKIICNTHLPKTLKSMIFFKCLEATSVGSQSHETKEKYGLEFCLFMICHMPLNMIAPRQTSHCQGLGPNYPSDLELHFGASRYSKTLRYLLKTINVSSAHFSNNDFTIFWIVSSHRPDTIRLLTPN